MLLRNQYFTIGSSSILIDDTNYVFMLNINMLYCPKGTMKWHCNMINIWQSHRLSWHNIKNILFHSWEPFEYIFQSNPFNIMPRTPVTSDLLEIKFRSQWKAVDMHKICVGELENSSNRTSKLNVVIVIPARKLPISRHSHCSNKSNIKLGMFYMNNKTSKAFFNGEAAVEAIIKASFVAQKSAIKNSYRPTAEGTAEWMERQTIF